MQKSDQINELFAALAKAQGEMTSPPKDKTANILTRDGKTYQYSYADLATIITTVRKPLAANGLSVSQQLEYQDDFLVLITILAHSSGQWCASTIRLPPPSGRAQDFGATLTFYRRYSYCGILGIAADDDTDGDGAAAPPQKGKAQARAGQGKSAGAPGAPGKGPGAQITPPSSPPAQGQAGAPKVDPKSYRAQLAKRCQAAQIDMKVLAAWLETQFGVADVDKLSEAQRVALDNYVTKEERAAKNAAAIAPESPPDWDREPGSED